MLVEDGGKQNSEARTRCIIVSRSPTIQTIMMRPRWMLIRLIFSSQPHTEADIDLHSHSDVDVELDLDLDVNLQLRCDSAF